MARPRKSDFERRSVQVNIRLTVNELAKLDQSAAEAGLRVGAYVREAADELKTDHRRKAAELAAIGRDMHEHYRTELANLGADYQRDKSNLKSTHCAQREALQAEIRQSMKQAVRDLADAQRIELRTTVWREKSLLGRFWNAYDVGKSADSISQRIGRTLWATASRSVRVDHIRPVHSEQGQALYQDLKHQANDRTARLQQQQAQEVRSAYDKFQAARDAALRKYDHEQRGYRRLWADRASARREAWRAYRANYRPIEHERIRQQRQQKNLQRIKDRAREFRSGEFPHFRSRAYLIPKEVFTANQSSFSSIYLLVSIRTIAQIINLS